MYCMQCFSSETILVKQTNNCLTISGAQAINMPKQGENILKFNNLNKQLPVPFIIYLMLTWLKMVCCKSSERKRRA